MKKILTLALAAAMLTATGMTAYATNITQDNSDPKTGGTDVEYTVAPVYTVVIPETVTLTDSGTTETISIYGETADDNVVIGKTQKVNVALTASTNGFNVKNADGETIAYTVNDKNAVDDLTTVAECAAGAKQNTDITFKKTGETKYAGTYTDTLTFTVSLADAAVAVTGVTLNKTTTTIGIGKNETLTATVAPDDATDKTVTWTSSDESVATVDSTGKVTGVGAGTATITATAGSKSATCTVTVKKTLTLTGHYMNFGTGDTVDFSLDIQYTDSDTWKDIAEQYDEVSLVNNVYGPEEGKIVKLYQGTMSYGAELKSEESTYNYELVSINDKVSAYSSYYTE